MIYITGDCHGDFRKFSVDAFPEQKNLTKEDYVIICGDFGGVWSDKNSKAAKEDEYWLKWLDNKPFTTLFVDGNHENFNRLYEYPEEKWNGGRVHEIKPSVLHLMRGEIFELEGLRIFIFGGASSHDITDGIIEIDDKGKWKEKVKSWKKQNKMFRVKNLDWWDMELPDAAEMQNGEENLKKYDFKVDYIISHCCPQKIAEKIPGNSDNGDILTEYFDGIMDKTEFKRWFFGHHHDNMQIEEKFVMLYEHIVKLHNC